MSVAVQFGKLLIITSLFFHAFLLFQDRSTQSAFNTNLSQALKACDCIPKDIQAHLRQHLHLVVAGLLASSALLLFTKCWCFKLPVLVGLLTNLWVNHHSVFNKVPNLKLLDNSEFWHAVGVIGAVLYLAGS